MTSLPKRKYTSKHTRQKDAFVFDLTQRDEEVLSAINKYRYLKVEQIKRLFFPNAKTNKNTAKRLKFLFHSGYLGRLIPYEQAGSGSSACAYYIDKKGAEHLRINGEKSLFRPKSGKVKHLFLNHALDVSEFRINIELALKEHPIFTLRDIVLDFEIQEGMQNAVGYEKYKLFKKFEFGVNKTYQVYPDIQFVMQGRNEHEHLQALFFVEIDRGTMDLGRIKEKVIAYNIFNKENFYNRLGIGEFKNFRVLIQTSTKKRADNIKKILEGVAGSELIWITNHEQVNELSVFHKNIWKRVYQNDDDIPLSILKS